MRSILILGSVLLLGFCSVSAGAEKLRFEPPPSWVRPSALPAAGVATATPLKVLLLDRQLHFSDRSQDSYNETAIRIQTPQGLGGIGTISLAWNPETDVLTVHKVHILRGGKTIDVLGSGQTFTIARREANLEYAALDGTLTAIIQPAGLQVGDIVDIAYTLSRTDPVLARTAEGLVDGLGLAAIARVHVSAEWPTSLSVQWRASDGLTGLQQTRAGSLKRVSVTLDDLKPVVQPRGAPARYAVDPRIEVSSFASWQQVASFLAPLYEKAERLSPHSPLLAEVARIRAATTDPKARAMQALDLVENQVRYVYLGMNDGGLIPAEPDLTWSRRFGDCKGKSVLLVTLLRALGIDAVPVAVSTKAGALVDQQLPMISLFDHVIVRAVIGGKAYWLDGTRLGDHALDDLQVPYYHWGLPLVARGGDLVKLEPPPPQSPLIDTAIRIDATAGITTPAPFHVETLVHGDAGIAFKLRLANLEPTQLDQALRSYWEGLYSFVKIKSVSATFDEHSFAERLTMDGTAQMDWSGNRYETDGLGVGYQANFEREPGPHQDAPFAVTYPLYSRVSETIQLPDGGMGFSTEGKDIDRTVAGLGYQRHAQIANGVFHGETSQRSVAPEFPFSEASSAQQALRDLAKSTLYIDSPAGYSPTASEISSGVPKEIATASDQRSRGNLLMSRREYDAAIKDFTGELAYAPRDATALADRGLAHLLKRDLADGRRDLEAAAAIDPHNAIVFDDRGLLAMQTQDWPAAVSAFGGALQANPKDNWAFEMRARSELALGEKDKALADLARAAEVAPKDTNPYELRAMILISEHKKEAALGQAKLLLATHPRDAAAYLAAGGIYARLNERDRAIKSIDRAIEIAPSEAAYLYRARLRPDVDLPEKRADFEAASRLNPESASDLQMLAQIDLDTARFDDAISEATRAMKIAGQKAELLTIRGIGYARTNRATLAESDFSDALGRAPAATQLNTICWELAMADVQLPRALEACRAAVSQAKGREKSDYLDSEGLVLLRLGRCDEAIASYDSALEIKPILPTALYGRGICELRTGKVQAGRKDMKDGQLFGGDALTQEFERHGVRP